MLAVRLRQQLHVGADIRKRGGLCVAENPFRGTVFYALKMNVRQNQYRGFPTHATVLFEAEHWRYELERLVSWPKFKFFRKTGYNSFKEAGYTS